MKDFWRVITIMILTASVSAGCGAAETTEEKAPVETVEETEEAPAAEETAEAAEETAGTPAPEEAVGEMPETLEPDPTNLTYLEEYQIEDFYGDGKEYSLYAPKGGDNTDGSFYYDDHGITFTASVFNCGYPEYSSEFLQMYLDETVNLKVEDWKEDPECSDIGVGETLAKGDDRYLFLTVKKTDYNGTPYQRRMLIYMSVRDGGVGVFWDMELREYAQDEETAPLIAEVARCYGLNLSELAMEDGTWAEQNAQHEADRQDVYEPKEGEIALEKVDGYQYLGVTTLSLKDGTLQCPAMAPMGWNTEVQEDLIRANMHGVSVYIRGFNTGSLNYMGLVEKEADSDLRYRSDPEEGNRNVKRSEVMAMSGNEEAVYYIVEYDEQSYRDENYYHTAEVNCYIRLDDDYLFACDITLRSEEYDSATNVLMKELETAYGIDMSAYYREEE